MDFDSARKQYQRLSRLFHNGDITEEEFIQGVDNLAITDQDGTEWQIGLQSGRWYRRDGLEWIEDQPMEAIPVPRPKRGRRAMFAFLVLLLLLLALFGANYFSKSGNSDQDSKGEGAGAEQTLAVSQGTATLTPDEGGEEPSESELTPTPSPVSEEPTPTTTATLLPPPPRVPPQVWEVESQSRFTASDPLIGEWLAVPEYDWEHEIIQHEGEEGLFLQFTDRVELWHADLKSFTNTDRNLRLALPNAAGKVSLACHFNPNPGTGFVLNLTRQSWALSYLSLDEEGVLAEGENSETFQQGEYEDFRLRCAGNSISAWNSQRLLVEIDYAGNSEGALGLFFDFDDGVGVAVIASDQVLVYQGENRTAEAGNTVWLDALEVTLADIYASGTSAEPVLATVLRIANWGETGVTVNPENIYLTNGDQRIYPLEFVLTGREHSPLPLPLTPTSGYTTGEIYFGGVAQNVSSEWQLVLDLRYEGYGEAVFSLGN